MVHIYVPNLTATAVRVDPRDAREYAGKQEASPLYDICHHPQNYSNVRFFDEEIVIVDDANAKVSPLRSAGRMWRATDKLLPT